jgi:uncharacterized metal-binding protein
VKYVMKNTKPLVFACSGCSHLATMANDIALTLDSDGIAEMSCVSWLMAASEEKIKAKSSGRKIILIEGCGDSCSRDCLIKAGVDIDAHFNIADLGFIARSASDGSLQENSIAMNHIYDELNRLGLKTV